MKDLLDRAAARLDPDVVALVAGGRDRGRARVRRTRVGVAAGAVVVAVAVVGGVGFSVAGGGDSPVAVERTPSGPAASAASASSGPSIEPVPTRRTGPGRLTPTPGSVMPLSTKTWLSHVLPGPALRGASCTTDLLRRVGEPTYHGPKLLTLGCGAGGGWVVRDSTGAVVSQVVVKAGAVSVAPAAKAR